MAYSGATVYPQWHFLPVPLGMILDSARFYKIQNGDTQISQDLGSPKNLQDLGATILALTRF